MLKSRRRIHSMAATRRGAVIVEFALAAPILFLVFFGMIEFCRFNMVRHGIDSATYEGARRGIVPGARTEDVRAASQRILKAISAVGATIDVQPAVILSETETVTVRISIPFDQNGWVVPHFLKDRTLTRSCTLSREEVE